MLEGNFLHVKTDPPYALELPNSFENLSPNGDELILYGRHSGLLRINGENLKFEEVLVRHLISFKGQLILAIVN